MVNPGDSSASDCGLWRNLDGVFVSWRENMTLDIDAGKVVLVSSLANDRSVTTPPAPLDDGSIPMPLSRPAYPRPCRLLPCQLSTVRGTCATYDCAAAIVGPQLAQACRPCWVAHCNLA